MNKAIKLFYSWLFVISILSCGVLPEQEPEHKFSGNDWINSIISQNNTLYLVGGTNSSNTPHGLSDFYIIEIDTQGNLKSETNIGSIFHDVARDIHRLGDTLLVSGESSADDIYTFINDGQNIESIKLNATASALCQTDNGVVYLTQQDSTITLEKKAGDLKTLLSKTYSLAGNSIIASDQNYYVIAEESLSDNIIGITQLDTECDTIWSITYENDIISTHYSVGSSVEGDFLLFGKTSSEIDSLNNRLTILGFNKDGQFKFDTLHKTKMVPIHAITIDNKVVVLSTTGDILMLDNKGSLISEYTLNLPFNHYKLNQMIFHNSFLYIVGYVWIGDSKGYDALCIKSDTTGTIQWIRNYGTVGNYSDNSIPR